MDTTTGHPLLRADLLPPSAAAVRVRMEVDLALAQRLGKPTSLLAVAIEEAQVEGAPPNLGEREREAVLLLLRAAIGPDGPPALAERGLYFALLTGRELDDARAQAVRLVEEAKHLRLPGVERELRVALSIGLARDERGKDYWLETLLSVAAEGVDVARGHGGEAVAHTELYALCQRKAERAGPRPRVVIPPELEARARASALAGPRAARPPLAAVPATDGRAAPAADADGTTAAPAPAADPNARPDVLRAIEARDREHREEVERLERRIAKLMETLDATERQLRDLARRQGEPLGVPSIYREVQGIDAEDESFKLKASLMEKILEANLELRAILRSRGDA